MSTGDIFLTGGTGYLGGYTIVELLARTDARLHLLVRAKNESEAEEKLWRALCLHMDGERFYRILSRIRFVPGDLTAPGLGLNEESRKAVVRDCDSVLHIAASLNRKSAKSCLNVNLRGTLSVIKLAQRIAGGERGLRRYSHVSTVAVAGRRHAEVIEEDQAIDWDRSDYDPYGRTKKFCEHMARELLPGVPKLFFRPSIVMGDSRHPRTTQFDMVRAFCTLADMPIVPFSGALRQDIVNADYVGRAVATIHIKDKPAHDIYHLSSGRSSHTAEEIARALVRSSGRRPARFAPALTGPFAFGIDRLAGLPKGQLSLIGSLFKVFLPYITYDTVFANERVVRELGEAPVPFTEYCTALYEWATKARFRYPYSPLPPRGKVVPLKPRTIPPAPR
jgi:thioester reductase-like protein